MNIDGEERSVLGLLFNLDEMALGEFLRTWLSIAMETSESVARSS